MSSWIQAHFVRGDHPLYMITYFFLIRVLLLLLRGVLGQEEQGELQGGVLGVEAATSSPSASGRSNGARLVSPTIAIM